MKGTHVNEHKHSGICCKQSQFYCKDPLSHVNFTNFEFNPFSGSLNDLCLERMSDVIFKFYKPLFLLLIIVGKGKNIGEIK